MDRIDELNNLIRMFKKSGENIKNISDGNHTFFEYIEMRNNLFIALCNVYPDISWKSKKHYDEVNDPMFNGDFIAGINAPDGTISFHLKMKYWDDLKVIEIDNSPLYDGYLSEDVYTRIKSLYRDK